MVDRHSQGWRKEKISKNTRKICEGKDWVCFAKTAISWKKKNWPFLLSFNILERNQEEKFKFVTIFDFFYENSTEPS